MRFEPPRITLVGAYAVSELTSYLVRLAEKLNVAFDRVSQKTELDEIKKEIEVNREYVQRLCNTSGEKPPEDVSWKN